MFGAILKSREIEKLAISTGNIINVNAPPLRESHEELLDSLKLCTRCQGAETQGTSEQAATRTGFNEIKIEVHRNLALLLRASSELHNKIKEYARHEISIGVKLFLNKPSRLAIEEAVKAVNSILKVDYVDNFVLAFHPLETASKTLPETPDVSSAVFQEDSLRWSKRNKNYLEALYGLWQVLQTFSEKKLICQLGTADLDVDALRELHKNARVPPMINQVNLVNCCVVPPELKSFCSEHDIQLLTHNDPEIIISDENFVVPNYKVDWSLRYQIHIRCRGVLAAKGYIVQASKLSYNP